MIFENLLSISHLIGFSLTAGLFTKSSTDLETASGAFYSNGAQLGVQLLGVVTTVAWSLLCTYLLTWLIRLTVSSLYFPFYFVQSSPRRCVVDTDVDNLGKSLLARVVQCTDIVRFLTCCVRVRKCLPRQNLNRTLTKQY